MHTCKSLHDVVACSIPRWHVETSSVHPSVVYVLISCICLHPYFITCPHTKISASPTVAPACGQLETSSPNLPGAVDHSEGALAVDYQAARPSHAPFLEPFEPTPPRRGVCDTTDTAAHRSPLLNDGQPCTKCGISPQQFESALQVRRGLDVDDGGSGGCNVSTRAQARAPKYVQAQAQAQS